MGYIEGGWPGSNDRDEGFFKKARKEKYKNAKLVAFGSTRRARQKCDQDFNIQSLLNANTSTITIVGKAWDFHVSEALKITNDENLELISDSISYLSKRVDEVFFDAEHFFDGFKDSPDYAYQCLEAAIEAGVDNVTLCDTNGGTMPSDITSIVSKVHAKFPQLSLGIHCHNDCELAVANSLASIKSGVTLLQGTVNGYGERCGNANLISLLGTLLLKPTFNQAYTVNSNVKSSHLSTLSKQVADIANMPLKADAAYVGNNAFSHKGGIHVAAIAKASKTYEHIDPAFVGNQRDITISDVSGKSNVQLQAKKLGLDVSRNFEQVLESIKSLEKNGLTLENAPGSFEMLVRKQDESYQPHFTVLNIQSSVNDLNMSTRHNSELCTATVKVRVKNKIAHVVEEASGPVDALNLALKKALTSFFPQVRDMQLTDYKVSILDPEKASAATTRVWLQSGYKQERWATIGCSDNILKASAQALIDSYQLFLIKFSDFTEGKQSTVPKYHSLNFDHEVSHNGNA